MPLSCQRALFDLPDDITYLNSASQSPALGTSFEGGMRGLRRKLHPWTPERANLASEMERCRSLFGGLIGAETDDVAIVFSTSYGIATAAANLRLEPGKDVLMLGGQFPSNVYAWIRLARIAGGDVRLVRRGEDFDWTGPVLESLDDGVGIVALPNCHWSDGSLVDLEAVSAECRRRGIPLVVDATQSIAARPFDLRTVQADFVVASGYKWLLCPDTMGFMYVAPKHHRGMPLELNQQSRIDAPSMESGDGIGGALKPNARRYDMGAADSMIHMPMSVAALEQITDWTPAAIHAYLTELVDAVADRAAERGLIHPAKNRRIGHFIGLYRETPWPDGLAQKLAARGIHISFRNNALRISPYLFNDMDDIDRLFEALDAELA
ncbi:aminotransferase class V-fold PLP-dependent enzyme [Nisaea acidiphila]|uniref:Aminotransferase class V-fold PLP-dependent enzyme n=1 Tax=Nisaea acidiphila TaxID=1862145 RepID=A0A9J7ARB9_9PROT|nr:aminotransferase class V-fold PLP-dependent enzyme [Nisaea acidiphila]UUX50155.1 aminotransferase class V-fold PLP-dependent enzyme [Nisaea acidiphila]